MKEKSHYQKEGNNKKVKSHREVSLLKTSLTPAPIIAQPIRLPSFGVIFAHHK
jgi:hypothetical protein